MKKLDFNLKKLNKTQWTYVIAGLVSAVILICFVALIAIPSVKKATINNAKEDLFENYFSFPETGLVTSRNGFGENKENSLVYVKSAMQNGADCIEVDICFSENGTPYVAESADKITENSMPLEYLMGILSEEHNDDDAIHHTLNMHLTDAANIEEIDRIVKAYGMLEYCFFTGVNINQAKFIKQSSEIGFYVDYELKKSKTSDPEYISNVANEIATAGGMGINCTSDSFSNIMRDIFKENWLKISFYGADSELEIIEALSYGPNQIITENPATANNILSEWSLNAPSSDIIQYD